MKTLAGIKGIGPKREESLRLAGVHDIPSLLDCLPKSYLFADEPAAISSLRPGEACVQGTVLAAPTINYFGGRSMVRARIADKSGQLRVNWFNQPWMAKQLKTGQPVMLYGQIQAGKNGLVLGNPKVIDQKGIIPQYKALPGLPGKVFAGFINQALASLDEQAVETLPAGFREEHRLCGRAEAWRYAHQPNSPRELDLAKRRLGFESLLMYQAAIRLLGSQGQSGPPMTKRRFQTETFWEKIPFRPTSAQERTLAQVVSDMEKPSAMRRLVQGDVGSGKTVVAFGAAVCAIQNGYQCAMMAPTELLARQHFASAERLLAVFGIRIGLLTGGMKAAERRKALQAIAQGEWQLVIGTHALISKDVAYHNLGLAITDEQHRFGVRQRQTLAERAVENSPHILALSATPIPRSLALVLYGDLKVSVMDELPPGRTPVKTRVVPESKRGSLYQYIRAKAIAGEQSYLVCPLIEDAEDGEDSKTSAVALYEQLRKGELKGIPMALTYGNQDEKDKEKALSSFYSGEAKVLVSTTVIEVGMDVPNATTMVIEDAEQFGLAQLHQLRGRVGRGELESWCFLLGNENERLTTLTASNDGFYIAQKDLEQRGPGEFLGTRQHGQMLNTYGVNDMKLIDETARCLESLSADPKQLPMYELINKQAKARFAERLLEAGMH